MLFRQMAHRRSALLYALTVGFQFKSAESINKNEIVKW